MSKAVPIGVIGLGDWGGLHARTLAGLAEAELVALVDRSPAARDAAAKGFPGVRFFDDPAEAVKHSGARAWVVATRTDSHVPITAGLLRAGHHVLLEKPIAPDAATARTLAPLVAPDSANLLLGHVLLFSPEVRQVQDQIKRRGPVRYFHAFRHRGIQHSTLYPEETPLRFTMIHDLYVAMMMTGGEEPSRFWARLQPCPGTQGKGYDLALAQIEWPSGAWGSFTASFLTPPGMARDGFDRLDAFGQGWALQMRMNPQPIEVYDDRAHWPISYIFSTDPPAGMLAEELRWFCKVARGEATPPIGARFEDALRLQGWLDKLEASALSSEARS